MWAGCGALRGVSVGAVAVRDKEGRYNLARDI